MIEYLYLGRVGYGEGLKLQAEAAAMRLRGQVGNLLLLLEHPPVLTLGRNANRENILASSELLKRRGVEVHEINRGGDVTYHGPGQLVGYPIFDLRSLRLPSGNRMGPVDFVRRIEEVMIRMCGQYGVRAGRVEKLTGTWIGAEQPITARKIGAIGIHVSRGITSHGFAYNLRTDLSDFGMIVPCGIADHAVTSLEREIAKDVALPSIEELANQSARLFGQVFDEHVLAVESFAALRERPVPEVKAEG